MNVNGGNKGNIGELLIVIVMEVHGGKSSGVDNYIILKLSICKNEK